LIFHPGEGHRSSTLTPTAVADSRFLCTTGSFAAVKHPYHVLAIGDCTPKKLSAHFRGLKTLMKRRADVRNISAACRKIALEAARHTTTISRNLISVEMEYGGRVRLLYHPEHGENIMLMPDILSVDGTLLNASVTSSIVGDQIAVKLRGKSVKPAG
jgi:hypothetical protein